MLDIKHADLTLNDPQELSWLFAKAAHLAPDNLAVVHNENSITYRELDLLSNRYAKYLNQVHNIESGDMVCVVYDRGIDFIISILAILKCGGTYVPIDTKEPSTRHKMIIEDVNPKLMIIDDKYSKNFDFPNSISIREVENIDSYSDERKHLHIGGHNIACVFFTSGSTGKPKGVLMPHMGITGLIRSPHYLTMESSDNVLSSSSIAFDAASFEIWTALLNSATLVCIDYEVIINPEEYANFLDHHDITVMWVTSALFDQLVAFRAGMFKKVKYLLSGGDVVNPKTVYKVLNNDDGRPDAFINGYGPTEAGILATFHIVRELEDEHSPLPVGKALADTVLYVLDNEQKPVAPKETGELYIGGHRLARGYLNLPEKTAEHFIVNPFTSNPTDMLYRTGDLVHFDDDGSLKFSGRADRQIKFRGFRLELDGIENVLVSHESVANAAIKMVKYKSEKILVAYIQLEKNQKDNFFLSEYMLYLKSKMPAYSVPTEIVLLDKLPVTQRGKIDRKNLPDPVFKEIACDNIVQPQTQTQKIIYGVWSECLGRTEFGIKDNFFELGGSSILLATVYAGIRSKINKPFSLNTFFEMPTIEGLATSIDEHGGQFDHNDEFVNAKRDSILDKSIFPNWSDTSKASKDVILLTGSMGYLGAHVLLELLEKTSADIYCLLRSHENISLHKQQLHALEKLKLEDALKFSDRIHTISGDISKEKLGINEDDYAFIVNNATHIIHCAAAVNHMYGYSKLKTSNSLSTIEFIKIAMNGKEKKISYISTESAISQSNADGVGYETKVSETPADFFGGYALTKWVSERLLKQAFDRGMSGLILRPGNIFLNTKTGVSSPLNSNFALLMMRAYVDTGLAPDLGFVFEAVPVNQLAKAIVSVSLGESNKMMLNLSNQNEISLKEYVSLLGSITNKKIEIIPFDEWKTRVIVPLKETSPLFPLRLYFQDDASEELMHFDTSLAQSELKKYDVHFDDNYEELLGNAFDKTFNKALNI
ncbi:amino acid adenylation domain-containing protein [Sulfurimonas sp.]|uniref:amino acid adenylation domain-containing protein n=1 Tax=Sulfurimonas sp. TaxID=2022749 RepID=UPI002AAFE187|nr:amino acid adenylation domain-containing protein [Sulfurimonas sp.]